MKTALLFIVLCFSLPSFGQNESIIHGFTATEFNGKVLLTWAIVQGETCNGVEILHSVDSVNFTPIGSIEGICGSTAASISYDFTDVDPIENEVNYYRLHLGGAGFSKIVSTEVLDLSGANFLLRPNPVVDFSELIFSNNTAATFELNVLSAQGKMVYEDQTNGELFVIDALDFDQGVYYFSIRKEGEAPKIKGKFIIY